MTRMPHVESYYAASAHSAPERPRLQGQERADVCIVGAGFAGLSAALSLTERGYSVIVLEKARVGWGASGRNGGQLSGAYATDMGNIRDWVGREDARRLFEFGEEAKRIIARRVEKHGIDCDLVWSYLHAANKPRHFEELRKMQAEWAEEYGYTGMTLVDRETLGQHIDSPAYAGGLYDPNSGHLHPLNYCLGLAAAAEAAGARIYEDSAVTSLDTGSSPVARTEEGEVRANYIVLCGNAYLGDLVPSIQSKVMPVGTYIGATPPLGRERALGLLPTNAAVCDSNFVLDYFRLSADWRMLFGGRVSYSTLMPPNLPRVMRARMLRVFPQLADQTFEYTWGGYVAITMERTPHIGRLGGNVYFAQGFSGHGVALTGVVGDILADAVAGQAERFDIMAKLPHTTFPGGRLFRTPTLVLAMMWYRMRDYMP